VFGFFLLEGGWCQVAQLAEMESGALRCELFLSLLPLNCRVHLNLEKEPTSNIRREENGPKTARCNSTPTSFINSF
jgi:hypothetical protein